MSKRKKTKKSRDSLWSLQILLISLIFLLLGVIGIVSYKYGFSEGKEFSEPSHKIAQEQQIKHLAKTLNVFAPKNDLVGKLQDVLSKENKKSYAKVETKHEIDPKHEFDVDTLRNPPSGPKREVQNTKLNYSYKKPKLVIVMDDVSFARDVRVIKALHMNLTMSFLPPSANHPDSARLASKEKFYMVHLPLEAMTFSAEEPITLHVGDSKEKIISRIKEIKRLFPRVYYVNNHTGSRFTANERAVKDLILALDKVGVGFLDSRTTTKTKVPKVMKSLGRPYIARDVFLDHEADVAYIQLQIKKAIEKAKKYGSAIAIGHPRKETLQALKNSKEILKSVELVHIDKVI